MPIWNVIEKTLANLSNPYLTFREILLMAIRSMKNKSLQQLINRIHGMS
jgi:hypothetical protein